MDARVVIVEEDGGSTSIDLGGEHESVVLGRGRGASLDDRTVSQMHVSLELQRQQQAGKADHEVPWVVKMRVLGSNPVCILRSSSSISISRSPRDVEFVGRGQEAALRAGDRLSLSIVKPMFYRVKEFLDVEGGSRNDGNKPEVLEASTSSSESKGDAVKEQKSLAIDKSVGVGLSNAAYLWSSTRDIDPVADLGFLVEGSEFDKYDRQRKPDSREWSWKSSTRTEEDEDGGLENAASRRKRKEDENEWHGEDEEEKQVVLSNVRVPQQRKETRSRAPIQSNVSRSIQPVGRSKRRRKRDEDEEEEDDDDDDDDPTLGGFIVDDIREEEAEQDGMEEEDIYSDDDSEEEAEDTEMPWCKYGSSCFRKNPEHLLKFRHPEGHCVPISAS